MRILQTIPTSALGLVVFVLLSGGSPPPRKKELPNIILIMADDLGYGDLHGYGAAYATPNLGKLASEGMRFNSFYAQPQCSPSRAALLTGCYPQRVGIPWVVGPEGPTWTKDKYFVGLNPDEQTLPELLKTVGYRTGCVGKWHLGHLPPHLPTRHGFDEYFGLPYSNDMWPPGNAQWPELPVMEGEKVAEKITDSTGQGLLTRQYTEKAVKFIEKNAKRPFFLYVAHSMPHVPIAASPAFRGKSGRGTYADVIQELDWSVGQLMESLRKNGLDKNTLVIFTSDNGPWLTYGNHAGSSGGLREGKATTFEGGVRVPMIARWPGKIPKGSSSNEVTGLIDLLPTLTEISGAAAPKLPIDGKSIWPLWQGKPIARNLREAHYYFQMDELQAVRQGRWKLHLPHTYETVPVGGKDGTRGASAVGTIGLSLFDLESDPNETKNVAEQHPEMVEKLKKMAETFRAELERTKRPAAKAL